MQQCRSQGWMCRGSLCAGMCPALGDGCDKGTCKSSPGMTTGDQSPLSLGETLLGEPRQVCEGWALPGWLLPTSCDASEGTCVPAAQLQLLADWEGVRHWF